MIQILQGDWIQRLKELPEASVQCCCTSPPYFGLRNYQVEGQVGLEKTPDEYVARLVEGFREVRRVLRDDGTLFLNLGDSYAQSGKGGNPGRNGNEKQRTNIGSQTVRHHTVKAMEINLKVKDLIGIPWMVAFALRADGWYLRSEITWCKKVPMPESVTDRPTSATEKIFLLTKSPKYFYDAVAVRNPPSESWANDRRWQTGSTDANMKNGYDSAGAQNPKKLHKMFDKQRGHSRRHAGFNDRWDKMSREEQTALGSNMRNFWLLGPEPCHDAHFATFPTAVPRTCILAGTSAAGCCPKCLSPYKRVIKDSTMMTVGWEASCACDAGESIPCTVLDPFAGSGTTGKVALELGRRAVLIELNPDYVKIIGDRTTVTPSLRLYE